jgi:hypothetical protein
MARGGIYKKQKRFPRIPIYLLFLRTSYHQNHPSVKQKTGPARAEKGYKKCPHQD